jgi:hypothetical protein
MKYYEYKVGSIVSGAVSKYMCKKIMLVCKVPDGANNVISAYFDNKFHYIRESANDCKLA